MEMTDERILQLTNRLRAVAVSLLEGPFGSKTVHRKSVMTFVLRFVGHYLCVPFWQVKSSFGLFSLRVLKITCVQKKQRCIRTLRNEHSVCARNIIFAV